MSFFKTSHDLEDELPPECIQIFEGEYAFFGEEGNVGVGETPREAELDADDDEREKNRLEMNYRHAKDNVRRKKDRFKRAAQSKYLENTDHDLQKLKRATDERNACRQKLEWNYPRSKELFCGDEVESIDESESRSILSESRSILSEAGFLKS